MDAISSGAEQTTFPRRCKAPALAGVVLVHMSSRRCTPTESSHRLDATRISDGASEFSPLGSRGESLPTPWRRYWFHPNGNPPLRPGNFIASCHTVARLGAPVCDPASSDGWFAPARRPALQTLNPSVSSVVEFFSPTAATESGIKPGNVAPCQQRCHELWLVTSQRRGRRAGFDWRCCRARGGTGARWAGGAF